MSGDGPTLAGRIYAQLRPGLPAPVKDAAELFLLRDSALRRAGWFRSRREGFPVDAEGRPLPWLTYPAIRFLAPRIRSDFAVFEFGAGGSTLWWAERVARVVAVEHNPVWLDVVRQRAPGNATVLFAEAEGYPGAARGGLWDVVVVDGICRTDCARQSLEALTPAGVVVWDNTDEDGDGYALLESRGFRRLDFWGLGPLLPFEWSTSIFYRPDNCLGI